MQMPKKVSPLATYRLQLHAGFPFDAAGEVADYLQALGVSHVYSSPYLQAAHGSMHGYDVVDHSRVNEELGGEPAHERLSRTLGGHNLGQVLDIVPNHMAITGKENTWWWDVLENGPASPYASYFDVEWRSPEERLRNKVLIPILGDHYGRVLKAGDLRIEREGGSFQIRYFEHALPAAPRSMSDLLADAARRSQSDFLAFLAESLARLPLPTVRDHQRLLARHRDKEVVRGLLARICQERPAIAATIDDRLAEVNANPDELDAILERQNFRLSFWKTAGRELGYRRFFDVNTLIGLRVEDEVVFHDTHRLLIKWLDAGVLDGLRVDHPDGLRDPAEYFERLAEAAPKAWIVAEKILEPGQRLRPGWQIAGTTGYDFLNVVNGVFIDASAETEFTQFYEEFSGEKCLFPELAHDKKLLVLREILASDITRLTVNFMDICENDRDHRDYTRHDIHHALRESIACFPVYRSYVRAERGRIDPTDARLIQEAIEEGKRRRPDLDPELFDFIGSVLRLERRGELESEFVMRYQQLTSPAMAKGVEDTAFYSYNRLISLNEVGGDPGRFGVSVADFHTWCTEMQARHPLTMVTTSTHDTKRSEDVRARINVLTEMPVAWREAVCRWALANDHYRTDNMPDRNTEYLLYQTLVGAWPIEPERLVAYMQKAAREAKQQTSWITPNVPFEEALERFIRAILDDPSFVADVSKFLSHVVIPGRINSLSQTLIKLTAVGVPDIYQGTEIWNLTLVDPDNRRPVDFEARRHMLASLDELSAEEAWSQDEEGLSKLLVTRRALEVRHERSNAFLNGAYRPIMAEGPAAEHVIAFARREEVITVAQRLAHNRGENWGDTRLQIPAGRWRDRFTGAEWGPGSTPVDDLLKQFPVALLTREDRR
jgi:(1->4)-alpha-D-glucan 1-alpha-D-glucosylmutase